MTYVIAGPRGNFTEYKALLEKIKFKSKDFLFVIGDLLGNADESFELVEELSYAENIWPVASGADKLAYEMLNGFVNMLKSGATPDPEYIVKMQAWSADGGREILDCFRGLDAEMKEGVLDYLAEMPAYEIVTVNEKDYLVCEKGITGYIGGAPESYEDEAFFGDSPIAKIDGYTAVIAGDEGRNEPDVTADTIMVDCGSGKGGRLCAYRLEDGKVFYAD